MTAIVDLDLDRTVLKRVLFWLRDWVSRNRDAIKVELAGPPATLLDFFDAYIASRFVDGVARLLDEAPKIPNIEIWGEIDRAINELRLNLRTSAVLRKQIANGAKGARELRTKQSHRTLWDDIKSYVVGDLSLIVLGFAPGLRASFSARGKQLPRTPRSGKN